MTTRTEDLLAPSGSTISERGAGRWASERRRALGLGVLAVLAFALSLLVQLHVLPLHSDNRDEGVYIFQAEMLREGMLTLPAEEYGTFFRPWLSGELDGRIFTEYQIGYPLFLAVSDLWFGSMRLGLALVAAATVPAAHAFARAMGLNRRAAWWAAVFVTLSPMTVLLSGMFVTYSLTVLLLLAASWALLVAADRRSVRHAALAGIAAGAASIVRPMDLVLFMLPIGALAVWQFIRSGPRDHMAAARLSGVVAAGVVPFVLLTCWYNSRTTGHPLKFPNMTADELNTFGFGTRRLVETEPTIPYGVSDAIRALWDNVAAVPSWLPGGALLLALAAVGLVLRRDSSGSRLPERLALLGTVATFPAGYFFWWATVLSAQEAVNGIGPHYYVPAMVALCVLAGRGFAALVPSRPLPIGVTLLAMGLLTAWAIPDKLADKARVTRSFERIDEAIPDDLSNAVVVVDYDGRPYTMSKYPFLRNDPRLQGDVLYAADRGPLNVGLFERFPDRDIYVVRPELRTGDPLFEPSGSFEPLRRQPADRLSVTVDPLKLPPGRHTRAYITVDGDTRRIDIGTSDDPLGPVGWELVGPGMGGDQTSERVIELTGPAEVVVGVETSLHADYSKSEWMAERHSVAVEGAHLVLLSPPSGEALARFPTATLEIPKAVRESLDIRVEVARRD